ncbi:hypothetical protein BpHYR1_018803 [Brachionus plicatilis]|uniref:Uncharacterized protein n=1 Tax=Brachionus plicatilis TaxID=10195 RepID=A0A3M7SVX9_BRAPC|nr:hypothetical protein BpHYR1_018803 [Brachionus plicatilis]
MYRGLCVSNSGHPNLSYPDTAEDCKIWLINREIKTDLHKLFIKLKIYCARKVEKTMLSMWILRCCGVGSKRKGSREAAASLKRMESVGATTENSLPEPPSTAPNWYSEASVYQTLDFLGVLLNLSLSMLMMRLKYHQYSLLVIRDILIKVFTMGETLPAYPK